jgi:hypothetical protein
LALRFRQYLRLSWTGLERRAGAPWSLARTRLGPRRFRKFEGTASVPLKLHLKTSRWRRASWFATKRKFEALTSEAGGVIRTELDTESREEPDAAHVARSDVSTIWIARVRKLDAPCRAAKAELDSAEFGGHSLRAGLGPRDGLGAIRERPEAPPRRVGVEAALQWDRAGERRRAHLNAARRRDRACTYSPTFSDQANATTTAANSAIVSIQALPSGFTRGIARRETRVYLIRTRPRRRQVWRPGERTPIPKIFSASADGGSPS